MKPSSVPLGGWAAMFVIGVIASYGCLRLSHVLVHEQWFSSEEGLNPSEHHVITGPAALRLAATPFVVAELAVHRWRCERHWRTVVPTIRCH